LVGRYFSCIRIYQ